MSIERKGGVVIVYKNKILLGHPTNTVGDTYSIPKGKAKKEETYANCAIRELKEEVGIDLSLSQLDDQSYGVILYKNPLGKIKKKLTYYILEIDELSEIGMNSEEVNESNLCKKEFDWAGFVDLDKAFKMLHWRQKDIVNEIIEKNLKHNY